MASTLKRLWGPVQPGTVSATRYTVPAATTTLIKEIWLTNTTASDASVNIGLNATAAIAANCILYQVVIPANKVIKVKTWVILAAAEILTDLQGTASAITSSGFGVELT